MKDVILRDIETEEIEGLFDEIGINHHGNFNLVEDLNSNFENKMIGFKYSTKINNKEIIIYIIKRRHYINIISNVYILMFKLEDKNILKPIKEELTADELFGSEILSYHNKSTFIDTIRNLKDDIFFITARRKNLITQFDNLIHTLIQIFTRQKIH